MQKLGILGGTFDPIHNGHLLMARDIMEVNDLEQILFVPNRQSPLKAGRTRTPASRRLEMVKQAIDGESGFAVSDLELNRPGMSFTVDTLGQLKLDYPDHELFFIMGSDSLCDLHRWRAIEEILEMCTVLVMARPGHADPAEWAQQVQLAPVLKEKITARLQSTRQVDISATEVRNRCRQGRSIKYLVPEAVERYIVHHQLYQH